MRAVIVLATLAVASPALAQGTQAPTGSAAARAPAEGTVLKSCAWSAAGSCPFDATKGTDYLVRVRLGRDCDEGGGKIELVDPAGRVALTLPLGDELDCDYSNYGVEFRAASTATYQLRYTPGTHATPGPGAAGADLVTDCRANATTRCAIPLGGREVASEHSANGDTDWFRLAGLRRGRLYTISATVDVYTGLTVVDAAGHVLAKGHANSDSTGTVRFRPKRNGTYFLALWRGYHRTLSMR
jgi:hypothetical protein